MARKYLNTLLIDGKPLLVPDEDVKITRNDLDTDDAGRDESGVMHRDVAREKVRTWEFPYSVLTSNEYEYIQSLIAGKPEFPVSFWGEEATAYCSNNSVLLRNANTGDYRDFVLKIIEC